MRKGACTYQAVRGVELDEYVVSELAKLKEEDNQYVKLIKAEAKKLKASDKNEQDILTLKKDIEKLDQDIMLQVKNLRDVSDALRPYVQADMDNMAKEIADKKKKLQKLDAIEKQRSDQYSDLSKTLEIAMNFERMTKDEDPEVIVSIIRSIVESTVTYGTCSVTSPYGDCIICPNRLYVNNFETLRVVAEDAFGAIPFYTYSEYVTNRGQLEPFVVALGMHSGHEINLNRSCSMDWVLAKVVDQQLVEYTGIEVQSIDITGNYRDTWYAYKNIHGFKKLGGARFNFTSLTFGTYPIYLFPIFIGN